MKALKYLIFLMLLSTQAYGQIVIVNPGNPPANPPIEPPGPRNPIIIRPDPTRPGGGDFDGKFYEYCGPSYLGYKCNFMRTEAVARMRDESTSYAQRNLDHYEKTLNAESAKVDNDLQAIRSGLDLTNSPAGAKIKGKLEQAGKYKASASAIDDSTLNFKKTAVQENTATIDVSFGLAFRDKDKTEYHGEANRVNLVVADRFVKTRITRELDRADAIETQIRNGAFDKKEDRLALVGGGRAALEISAQSLKEGDTGKSHFALQVGTVLLDTAISFTPILGWGKDAYEAMLGKNLLTGEELTKFEHTTAVIGVLTAGIGSKLAVAAKAGVIINTFKKGAETADAATDFAKSVTKAEELVVAAEKIGMKGTAEVKSFSDVAIKMGKSGDDLADAVKTGTGKSGKEFEQHLAEKLGGEPSFKVTNTRGTREFDGRVGNAWFEAKTGWEDLDLSKFKSDMGKGLSIATDEGASYHLLTNSPIPGELKDWLSKKGISFAELGGGVK